MSALPQGDVAVGYKSMAQTEAEERREREDERRQQAELARLNIRNRKATIIRKAWLAHHEAKHGTKEPVDPAVAMYLERLSRFDQRVLQQEGFCHICGLDTAKHALESTLANHLHFKSYKKLVVERAAPLLARLDQVRADLESQPPEHDEKAEIERFEALAEVERAYQDLMTALDSTESRHGWSKLGKVEGAAEFAEAACQAVTNVLLSPPAMQGEAMEATPNVPAAVAEGSSSDSIVLGEVDKEIDKVSADEIDDDDEDFLKRMAVLAKRKGKGRAPAAARRK